MKMPQTIGGLKPLYFVGLMVVTIVGTAIIYGIVKKKIDEKRAAKNGNQTLPAGQGQGNPALF